MPAELRTWAPDTATALQGLGEAVTRVRGRLATRALQTARQRSGSRGALAASIRVVATPTGFALSSDHPAAVPRETGELIRGTPWLAVPVRDGIQTGAGPRGDGRLFVVELRDGRKFLARDAGGGRVEIRWRLIDRVRPLRVPFLGPAMDEVTEALPGALAAEIRTTLGLGAA